MREWLHDALQKFLPKRLDDVIQKRRDHVELRFAAPKVMVPFVGTIEPNGGDAEIYMWNCLALDARARCAARRQGAHAEETCCAERSGARAPGGWYVFCTHRRHSRAGARDFRAVDARRHLHTPSI